MIAAVFRATMLEIGVRMLKKEISLYGWGDFLFGVNGVVAGKGDSLAKGEVCSATLISRMQKPGTFH